MGSKKKKNEERKGKRKVTINALKATEKNHGEGATRKGQGRCRQEGKQNLINAAMCKRRRLKDDRRRGASDTNLKTGHDAVLHCLRKKCPLEDLTKTTNRKQLGPARRSVLVARKKKIW